MRVLVTGAFGYVGSAVVELLAAGGHEVRALTTRRNAAPHPAARGLESAVEVVTGDVRDPEAMRRAVSGMDGICHLAALTRVREAAGRAAEYRDVNVAGTATVVAAANAEAARPGRSARPFRFVLASSAAVYGAVYGAPSLQPIPEYPPADLAAAIDTHEYGLANRAAERAELNVLSEYGSTERATEHVVLDVPPGYGPTKHTAERVVLHVPSEYGPTRRAAQSAELNVLSEYGLTKRAAERVVLDVPVDGRFGAVVLRVFNVAGASVGGRVGDAEAIVPKAMAVAAGAQPCLTVNGDGTAVRDFVHVRDVARAFAAALLYARPDRRAVFNVGAVDASVLDIVAAVRTASGRPVPLEHRPSRGEAPTLLADTRRIRVDLDWSPQYLGLRSIVADAWSAVAPTGPAAL